METREGLLYCEYTVIVYSRHLETLSFFSKQHLTPSKLHSFTLAIQSRRVPLEICFGFLDSMLRKIARLIYRQELVYNEWKHYHSLKYQAIVTPNGIITPLYEPVEGTKHDAVI
jgi:hypothetical protein